MDLNRLVAMLTRMFMRKAVNTAVNKGIDIAARRGKAPAEMTPEERSQARKARDLTKKARQAARITRRFGR